MSDNQRPLLHFSEDPTITYFRPRSLAHRPHPPPQVWAIDDTHAPLYYFPRNCPRVACHARADSSDADKAHFLGGTTAHMVIAIEGCWLARMRQAQLYVYSLPPETFSCIDSVAGTYTSFAEVTPLHVAPVGDLLHRLVAAEIEVRITPSLWPLHDAIVASSLDFNMIRMRYAQPRDP